MTLGDDHEGSNIGGIILTVGIHIHSAWV